MEYFQMINETIEFIENNLNRNIAVDELAERYHISKFYFTRIFKTLTGKNVKEYIDGRKMAEAAKRLKMTSGRMIDIALDFGFESHEAFTRKFKNLYGITPVEYRRTIPQLPTCPRIKVVERQFKNLHREMIVDFQIQNPGTVKLIGRHIWFNPDIVEELPKVTSFFNQFIADYILGNAIERMYNVTGGEAVAGEAIDYFAGFQKKSEQIPSGLVELTLEASDYAIFKYKNSMEGIHRLVAADVWKAILLSGLTLNRIGIHFFELYERNYNQTKQFLLYVPIKQ